MNLEQANVKKFMLAFDQPCPEKPTCPDKDLYDFRYRIIFEELTELLFAFECRDIYQIADALGDLLYVIYGTAIACGIDMEVVFAEIHSSNMSKFWNSMEVASRFGADAQELFQSKNPDKELKIEDLVAKKIASNKWIVKDTGGKVIKSPSYREVDYSKFFV